MSDTPIDQTSFTATVSVDQTPDDVFQAITNVRGWWSENIEGGTEALGDEFTYRHKDLHRCTIRVTEVVPGTRVVWRVLDNYFTFTDDTSEWTGTEIRFEIVAKDATTEIRFTHLGLVPEYECFDVCSNSWDFYLHTSLRGLIRTGRGLPNQKEQGASV
ncbi:MAG TPA: SRPBCC domain-containing protein [Acidimicrobiales bacterium]|nr:SRPBCC domain-containing protein [Acidimicrobiales bacterium]